MASFLFLGNTCVTHNPKPLEDLRVELGRLTALVAARLASLCVDVARAPCLAGGAAIKAEEVVPMAGDAEDRGPLLPRLRAKVSKPRIMGFWDSWSWVLHRGAEFAPSKNGKSSAKRYVFKGLWAVGYEL